MEYIIQQIGQELVKKVLERFENTGTDLNVLCGGLLEDCKEAARKMTETFAEEINRQMRADKEWRKGWLVLKEKDRPRRILTEIGEIHIRRDCYYDRTEGHCITPLDRVLGIRKYDRISASVGAGLVEAATEHSYAKSAKIVTGGAVSRQTVRNRVLEASIPEKQPEGMKRVKELHIFADEDHAHLQLPDKKKGKKCQIIPLVTVTEGIDTESGKRHRTVNPMSFVDGDFDTKGLWKSVGGYIGKAYDIEGLKKICIHADGGTWIRNGLEEYAQTVHVMDGFHFERDLKRIAGCFQGQNIRQRMHRAVDQDDRKKADSIVQEMMEKAEDERIRERAGEFGKYLLNHWDEIRTRRTGDVPGSCTEGLVSHLLSERFSRDPMGWSKAGLGKLSMARIYVRNGGELDYTIFERQEEECRKYRDYAEEMMAGALKGAADWSVFEQKEPMIFDPTSGTQQLLHRIGTCRNVLN